MHCTMRRAPAPALVEPHEIPFVAHVAMRRPPLEGILMIGEDDSVQMQHWRAFGNTEIACNAGIGDRDVHALVRAPDEDGIELSQCG